MLTLVPTAHTHTHTPRSSAYSPLQTPACFQSGLDSEDALSGGKKWVQAQRGVHGSLSGVGGGGAGHEEEGRAGHGELLKGRILKSPACCSLI